jgi:hypothetical protein
MEPSVDNGRVEIDSWNGRAAPIYKNPEWYPQVAEAWQQLTEAKGVVFAKAVFTGRKPNDLAGTSEYVGSLGNFQFAAHSSRISSLADDNSISRMTGQVPYQDFTSPVTALIRTQAIGFHNRSPTCPLPR